MVNIFSKSSNACAVNEASHSKPFAAIGRVETT